MNYYLIGAGAVASLWIIWTEWRIHQLTSQLLIAREQVKDEEIKARVHALSDAELNDLVGKDLGAGTPKT
jgi:hypothetical protein